MDEIDILNKVTAVIQDILDLSTVEIAPETEISTLEGWDSLTQINLFSALSSEFAMKFSIQEMGSMKSIISIVKVIQGKR